MNKVLKILAFVVVAILVASCKSTSSSTETASSAKTGKTGKTGVSESVKAASVVEAVRKNETTANTITAKVKVTITSGGKTNSTKGTLRMKKDDVIQLSLLDPLLGISEVGKMEFNTEKVIFIDRFNKRYVEEQYSGVDFLKKANIDFNSLQALFWNELFQPGTKTIDADKYELSQGLTDNDMVFKDDLLKYTFSADKKTALLKKTSVTGLNSSSYQLDFGYADFDVFLNKKFPMDIMLTFYSGSKKTALEFKISSINTDSKWETRTAVPSSSKYTKITADQFFKVLTK